MMTKSTLNISEGGTLVWRNKKGQVHRDNDQPAIIWPDGTKEWWVNDKRHRNNDKPAVIDSDGTKEWYVNGRLIKVNDD